MGKSTVDVVVVDRERRATLAAEHVAIEDDDVLATRPAVAALTKRLMELGPTSTPLCVAPEAKVAPAAVAIAPTDEADSIADESEGSGGLLIGGAVVAAATVLVIGAAGATAAIWLGTTLATEETPRVNPFAGADGQARRRVGLGF